jgi:hypothetical protein
VENWPNFFIVGTQKAGTTSRVSDGFLAILGVLLLSALLVSYTRFREFAASPVGLLFYFVAPATAGACCLGSLFLPRSWRRAIAFNAAIGVGLVIGGSLYLERVVPEKRDRAPDGGSGDRRELLEVVLELRRQGVDAFPAYSPRVLLARIGEPDFENLVSRFRTGDEASVPLTGVPKVTTVVCRESGEFLIYESDAMGFHNAPEQWGHERIDVTVVGDSFVQGYCVPPDRNLVAGIRKHFPETLNLGVGGAGPLTDLALLREYAAPLQPARLIWVYYENDLENLEQEKRHEVMRSYLDPEFSQEIGARRDGFEAAVREYIDTELALWQREREAGSPTPGETRIPLSQRSAGALTLRGLRRAVGRFHAHAVAAYGLSRRILETARNEVQSWGGELHFVYLPSWTHFSGAARLADHYRRRNRAAVLEIVANLGIPVTDVLSIFEGNPDPESLFLGYGRHYSERGYAVASEAVAEALRR